jgi:predicted phage terminase large subunit-like protein
MQNYSEYLQVRNRCSEDILSMARLLGNEVAPVHERMAEAALNPRSLVLAPRGFGKSTLLSVARSITEIVRNPDVRILLVSNVQAQAEAFVREIRSHLEQNHLLRGIYGDFTGSKWNEGEFIVSCRKKILKEPTMLAAGVGGAIISRHFDLIICDDIVDEENARTQAQREKLRVWFFKVLLPCLEPDGRLCIVGTRYHYRDLYGLLIESGFISAAAIIRAINEQGESSWPERFPIEKLEQIRREAGTVIFNAQYQNDTEAMKGAVFKEEWLKFYDSPPESLRVYQGIDLSIAQTDNADFFAVVTIGVDAARNIYVLDCYQARMTFRQQTAAILRKFLRFDPLKVAIESNAYQAAQADTLREMGIMRLTKVFTRQDKLSRAWKLSSFFEDGRVYLGRNMQDMVEQLLAFPQADHDDLFDALDFAVGLALNRAPRIRFL